MQVKALHLLVSGRVQGVGFRFFVQRLGESMGITGYVKNLYNSDVEVYAEGGQSTLYQFLDKIKSGPPLSRVLNVEVQWMEISEKKYKDFRIGY
ncbi:MAG: acylphosphatase [Spirochaetes bacterium]|nr:acylphosphatase [Spirochaetota bacterium]